MPFRQAPGRCAVLMCTLGLTLLGLSACGGAPQNARPVTGASPAAALPAPRVPDGPGAGDVLPPAGPDTLALRGLSALQVKARLGQPMFRRRDAPAEIWQYRARACTLDLFLYDDRGAQTVAHYAVRGGNGIDERACFKEITGQSPAEPTS